MVEQGSVGKVLESSHGEVGLVAKLPGSLIGEPLLGLLNLDKVEDLGEGVSIQVSVFSHAVYFLQSLEENNVADSFVLSLGQFAELLSHGQELVTVAQRYGLSKLNRKFVNFSLIESVVKGNVFISMLENYGPSSGSHNREGRHHPLLNEHDLGGSVALDFGFQTRGQSFLEVIHGGE
jgi:hypothetical protein